MNDSDRRTAAATSPRETTRRQWLVTTYRPHRPHLAVTAIGPLRGRALVLARTGWLAVATLTIALYLVSTWLGLGQLASLCTTGLCAKNRVPPIVQRALADLHLSVSVYNGYTLMVNVLFTTGFVTIAALIFWRRSRDPLALFVSLALLLFGAAAFGNGLLPLLAVHPGWTLPVEILGFLGTAAFGVFLYIFPDGRFVPRWTLLTALAWTLWALPAYLAPNSPYNFQMWPGVAYFGSWAFFLTAIVVAQVYRYRRVSTPAQRQQTKWVVFGLVAAAAGYFGGQLVLVFLAQPLTSAPALLALLAGHTLVYATLLLIPICIGIAMLRHHLFDIDLLIQQTLIYTALVASLALLYEGGTLVLVKVLLTFTGQESFPAELSVAFGVGALAEPLHRRIERDMTRVFYKRKYEAERQIEAFSKQIRRELGLVPASERLEERLEERVEARLRRMHPTPTAQTDQVIQHGQYGQDGQHAHVEQLSLWPASSARP